MPDPDDLRFDDMNEAFRAPVALGLADDTQEAQLVWKWSLMNWEPWSCWSAKSAAMKTVAWPSSVQPIVASIPHIASGRSGVIVTSWVASPRSWPVRVWVKRFASRISRNTCGFPAQTPGQP